MKLEFTTLDELKTIVITMKSLNEEFIIDKAKEFAELNNLDKFKFKVIGEVETKLVPKSLGCLFG